MTKTQDWLEAESLYYCQIRVVALSSGRFACWGTGALLLGIVDAKALPNFLRRCQRLVLGDWEASQRATEAFRKREGGAGGAGAKSAEEMGL